MQRQLPKFNFAEPDTNERIFGWPAEISTIDSDWSDIFYERRVRGFFETEPHIIQNHYFVVKLNPLSRAERSIDGRRVNEIQHRGYTAYIPHGCPHKVLYPDNMGELFILNLKPEFVDRTTEELNLPGKFSGAPKCADSVDPLVLGLGMQIDRELRQGNPHGQVFAETVAQMLAVHLITSHNNASRQRALKSPTLSGFQLTKTLEYIDANISESISLKDMADQVQLSVYHFSRAFRSSTGLPPYQFILSKRIEFARRLLKERDDTIQDIAFAVGFAEASQFTKHFRKVTGVTPSQYRRELCPKSQVCNIGQNLEYDDGFEPDS